MSLLQPACPPQRRWPHALLVEDRASQEGRSALTADQSTRIETIFQEGIAQLREAEGRAGSSRRQAVAPDRDDGDRRRGDAADRPRRGPADAEQDTDADAAAHAPGADAGTASQANAAARSTRREREQRATAQTQTRTAARPTGPASRGPPEPSKLVVDRLIRLEDSEMKSNGLKWLARLHAQPSCWRRPRPPQHRTITESTNRRS